jgi:hypothetical protein
LCGIADEAHRLSPEGGADAFKKEALGVLMQAMVNPDYRNKILIIFAGYSGAMEGLLASDEGLRRRLELCVDFAPLTAAEAKAIFEDALLKDGYSLPEDASPLQAMFQDLTQRSSWTNLADIAIMIKKISAIRSLDFHSRKASAGSETERGAVLDAHGAWAKDKHSADYRRFSRDDVAALYTYMRNNRPDQKVQPKPKKGGKNKPDFLFGADSAQKQASANASVDDIDMSSEDGNETKSDKDEEEALYEGAGGEGEGGGEGGEGDPQEDAALLSGALSSLGIAGGIDEIIASVSTLKPEDITRLSSILGVSDSADAADAVARRLKKMRSDMKASSEKFKADSASRDRELEAGLAAAQGTASRLAADYAALDFSNKKMEAAEIERKRREAEERVKQARAEQQRLEQERDRREKDKASVQVRIRHMGRCCNNFEWDQVAGGYRCQGGGHFVSNSELN